MPTCFTLILSVSERERQADRQTDRDRDRENFQAKSRLHRLMHVGHFLNGLGGPVAMAAPPILSAVWFPAKERTTATAIGTVLNYFGVALSFIMGLYRVFPYVCLNLGIR